MAKLRFAPLLALLVASIALAGAVTYNLQINWTGKYADGSTVPTGTNITYNLYAGDCVAAPTSTDTGLTSPQFSKQSPDGAAQTCVYATAVIGGSESDLSPPYTMPARPKKPAAPTITKMQ